MAYLQVQGSDDRIELVAGKRLTIGRSHSNEVRVTEKSVSHEHAAIEWTEGGAILRDLDMIDWQFVDEARRNRLLPHAVVPAILRETDLGALPRPGEADMSKPPLLFKP